MPNVLVTSDRYTIDDPLYQWDLNKILEIRGLSLPTVPEIHFANMEMDRAIVKQANMDSAGIITVDVPNTLLQKAYPVTAYICIRQGDSFESLCKIDIPVKARKKPYDYSFEDTDGEIYSFTALENQIANGLHDATEIYNATVTAKNAAEASAKAAAETLENALAEAEAMIPNLVNTSDAYSNAFETITTGLSEKNESSAIVVPAKHCLIGSYRIENPKTGQNPQPVIKKMCITDSDVSGEGTTWARGVVDDDGYLNMTYVLINNTDDAKSFYHWFNLIATPAATRFMLLPSISKILIPCTSK